MPLLIRFTARVSESPGTKPVVVAGTVKPGRLRQVDVDGARRPGEAIGVVLSVKVPKVPRPATAAAAPAMAERADDLAGGAAMSWLMSAISCVVPASPVFRRQRRLWRANRRPPASDPQGIRKAPAGHPQAPRSAGTPPPRLGRRGRGGEEGSCGPRAVRRRGAGRVSVKVVPRPSLLIRSSVPPCAMVMALVIARPSPTPGTALRCAVEARKKRVNSFPCSPVGMPMPVSLTGQLSDRDGARPRVGARVAVRRSARPAAATASPTAGGGELDGVGHEVVAGLPQPEGVPGDDEAVVGHLDARPSTPRSPRR